MNNKLLELVLKLTLTPKIKSAILYTFFSGFSLSFFFFSDSHELQDMQKTGYSFLE